MGLEKYSCADCGTCACCHSEMDRTPEFCMTKRSVADGLSTCADKYQEDNNYAVMRAAAEIKYELFAKQTRVEETITLFKKMGIHKVGIATCTALVKESRILAQILRRNGFEVVSASCQIGMVPMEDIGIPTNIITEASPNTCNPIMQAEVLNHAGTEYNILMGLCVGHDSLFYKYSDALVTTLVTKDRVTGHNPAAALYSAHSFYSRLLDEPIYDEKE